MTKKVAAPKKELVSVHLSPTPTKAATVPAGSLPPNRTLCNYCSRTGLIHSNETADLVLCPRCNGTGVEVNG